MPVMKLHPLIVSAFLVSCQTGEKHSRSRGLSHEASRLLTAKQFAKDSPKADVKASMGSPDSVSSRPGGMELWHYRFSTVQIRNGRVYGWNNASGNLKCHGPGETVTAKEEPLSRSLDDGPINRPAGAVVHGGSTRSQDRSESGYINPERVWVDAHQRADGSQVQGHLRTRGNSSTRDNMSSSGNRNPYTGERGYR